MEPTPACYLLKELTDAQALAIGVLKARTWPKPGVDAAGRAAWRHGVVDRDPGRPNLAARSFVLLDGETVVAHASMEPRELATDAGPLWVLGLGGVCSDPDLRGQGLGAQIVRAALAIVDDGLAPFSLFQTSHAVRPFYEKLGACLVENRFFDSTADDPEASPFWDEVVMRYPAGPGWPTGPIDLRGPGY